MDKDKQINEMRGAICKDANTEMCIKNECPRLYRCPLGEPTIDGLVILVEKGYGNIKEFAERVKKLSIAEMNVGKHYLCIPEEYIDELLKEYE